MARDRIIETDPRNPERKRARVWDALKPTSSGKLGAYRTRSGFATERAARAWCNEQASDIAKGRAAPVRGLTVGVELDRYLAQLEGSALTRRTFVVRKSELARVPASIRARPLRDLMPSEVIAWRSAMLSKGYALATVRQTVNTLAMALDAAIADRRLDHNAARNLPKLPRKRRKVTVATAMPADLIAAVVAELPEVYKIAVALMLGAGLRLGECFGLTLDRVDFLRRTVMVDRQWSPNAELAEPGRNGATHGYGFADPKHGSVRPVPVPDSLLAAINAHVAEHGLSTEATICRTEYAGKPVTEQQWADVWHAATKRAGVSVEWTAHDLRHAFASRHYNAGTPATVVARWCGHTLQTFLATYAHPEVEDERPSLDLLADVAPADRVPNVYRLGR